MRQAAMLGLATSLPRYRIDEHLGLANGTVTRWAKSPKYQAIYKKLEEELKQIAVPEAARSKFVLLVLQARDELAKVLEDDNAPRNLKVQAALELMKLPGAQAIFGNQTAGSDILSVILQLRGQSAVDRPLEGFEKPLGADRQLPAEPVDEEENDTFELPEETPPAASTLGE